MDKYKYYKRDFLNKPEFHTTAFVLATIRKTLIEDHSASVDAEITLSDCNRQITISLNNFYYGNEDDTGKDGALNNLAKLDYLIETLIEYRKAYKESVDEFIVGCDKVDEVKRKTREQRNQIIDDSGLPPDEMIV